MGYYKTNRDFHEARWDEPIIMKLGNPGERGILVPKADEKVTKATGTVKTLLPKNLIRKKAPKLPEMSQMQVLRHYMRLSQETIGTDFNIDIGLGTCTMKYSPKIHEQLVRSEKLSEVHPYQDESTIQGILEIMYRDEQYIKAISGMDKVSLQPGGGTQAIFANVETIRAYHESRGEGEQRNEIITTILSHPGNPGAAATLGYKVITLYPDENGVPDIDALKAAVSEHTAALMITNPEDTGIYNEKIKEFVDIVHAVGGLCVYDQANLNGLFGITRARDAGFDMCHYNLHKSFSSPHGCQGPAAGAQCVCEKLAKFVAAPTVEFDGEKYYLDYNRPDSIGKLRKFYGVPAVLVRTYAYIRTLGPDGMKQIADLHKIAAMMVGSYTGGSVNMVAMSDAFGASGDMVSSSVVADNLLMALYFFVLIAIPTIKFFLKKFKHPYIDEVEARKASGESENQAASYWKAKPVALIDIAEALAIAFAIVAISTAIADFFAGLIPTSNFGLSLLNGLLGNKYLIMPTLTMLLATIKPEFMGNIGGAQEIGTFLIHIFFAVIGVPASIYLIVTQAPLLLVFCAIIVGMNMIVSFVFGKIFKFNLEEICIASNANIGGPTTAAALAIAKGWQAMVVPALLVGTLGYVIGNYYGIFIGTFLGR